MSEELKVSILVGMTLTSVEIDRGDWSEVRFKTTTGRTFRLWHNQDCCETVRLTDIVGNPEDLVGVPLLMADESTQDTASNFEREAGRWTFYKFGTIKGYVDLRWEGYSDYYSVAVDFEEVKDA